MYNGHDIFKLVDTYGLPLDIIVLEFRDDNKHFNVEQFIESAIKAGWKKKRVWWMLSANCNDEKGKELLSDIIDYKYDKTKKSF